MLAAKAILSLPVCFVLAFRINKHPCMLFCGCGLPSGYSQSCRYLMFVMFMVLAVQTCLYTSFSCCCFTLKFGGGEPVRYYEGKKRRRYILLPCKSPHQKEVSRVWVVAGRIQLQILAAKSRIHTMIAACWVSKVKESKEQKALLAIRARIWDKIKVSTKKAPAKSP
eukprot:281690-Pelagomonas_calceolata.AAC.5